MIKDKQCLICSGTGRKQCGTCSGRGYLRKVRFEYDANGRSREREHTESHVECGGTGRSFCYACSGTGRVPSNTVEPRKSAPIPLSYREAWQRFAKHLNETPCLTKAESEASYQQMLDLIIPTKETYKRLQQFRRQWEPRWNARDLEGKLLDATFNMVEIAALKWHDV